MDEQMQDDQQEPIYNSSVPIQGVALKTSRDQWTIERSMPAMWHDDDDDDELKIR